MKNIDYFKWILKYKTPKIFSRFFWRNIRYDLKGLVYPFFNKGIPYGAEWNIYSNIAERFLILSKKLESSCHGYPCDFKDINQWIETIRKMRYAMFLIRFLQDNEFSCLIDNRTERKACYVWANRHFKYIKEFIPYKFFLQIATYLSINIKLEMNHKPCDESKLHEMVFTYFDKRTGKQILPEPSIDITQPDNALLEKLQPDIQEGLELFTKYFRNLWD